MIEDEFQWYGDALTITGGGFWALTKFAGKAVVSGGVATFLGIALLATTKSGVLPETDPEKIELEFYQKSIEVKND